VDPVAHTVALAGICITGTVHFDAIPRQRWNASVRAGENKLYWPLSRTYDRAAGQTIFTLSDAKGGSPVDITCTAVGKPYGQETMNLAGQGYFKETISIYAGTSRL